MRIPVKFKRLSRTAQIPVQATRGSAGFDLSADISDKMTIVPHTTVKIPTGIVMAIPEGYFGGIYARSGLASKQDLAPSNKVGIIDSDYRGEIIVALHNHGDSLRIIEPGQKIAQMVIQPYLSIEFDEASELIDTDRGTGGFGSTDSNN